MKKAKSGQKRLDGGKKLLALTSEMKADIAAYCREKNIESESELIRQAVARYIYRDYGDETLKLQGLASQKEKIEELRDMLDVLFRYIRLMHINLLVYNAPLDEGLADAAYASAQNRHDRFFDALQDSLKSDPPFFERLLHKYFSGEDGGQG